MTQLYGGPLSRGPAYQRYAARNKNLNGKMIYNVKYLNHPDLAEHKAAFDEQEGLLKGGLRWASGLSSPEKQREIREENYLKPSYVSPYGHFDPYSKHYTWNKNFKGNPHQDQYKHVPFWETNRYEEPYNWF